jgi:hypothetical protein
MTENDPVDELLRSAAKGAAEIRGDCPGSALLRRFEAGLLEGAEASSVQRHLRMCGFCDLSVGTLPKATYETRAFGFLRSPGFAYSLSCLLAIIAGAQFWTRVPPRPRVTSIPMQSLNQDRDTRVPPVKSAAGDQLLLFFQLPDRPGTAYDATITGAHGDVVTSRIAPCDENGNFCVVIDRRQFPEGHYKLDVAARNGAASRSYSFYFER